MSGSKFSILLSAPYMVPIYDEFRIVFEKEDIDVIIAKVEERLSEDELMQYAGDVDGVICGDDQFSEEVIEAFSPRLKVISKWGTGIDTIDAGTAERLGIKVCNTPDAFTDPVADTVMGYILAFARKGPWLDRAMKAKRWEKIPGRALNECTLGVVGVGRIGRAVLRRAKLFGLNLLSNDVVAIDSQFIKEVGVRMVTLPELLKESDFISLNCDLNPTSYHLIHAENLKLVKRRAVLINTARGSVVEEIALIEALEGGQIAGAALDVFEQEPLPQENPLLGMDNVMLAPHNANSSPRAWERVHRNTIRNLFIGLGLEPPNSSARRSI